MLELPRTVTLYDVKQDGDCPAELIRLTREIANRQIDGTWWHIEASLRMREAEEDHHWKWRKLVGSHKNDLTWDSLAIKGPAGDIEGAIIFRIDAKSQLEPAKGAIYVDRLAAAPWNRHWLVDDQRYRGVGSVLLLAAVQHSYLLGLEGRVQLYSLPTENTRKFYVNRGFQEISEDSDGIIRYELPAAEAAKWLKSKGEL